MGLRKKKGATLADFLTTLLDVNSIIDATFLTFWTYVLRAYEVPTLYLGEVSGKIK